MNIKLSSDKDKEFKDYDSYCEDDKFLDAVWYFSNRAKQRYYRVIIQKDLFETIVVTKVWGSQMRKGGKMVHMPCSSYSQALEYLNKIRKLRMRRGYELVMDDK